MPYCRVIVEIEFESLVATDDVEKIPGIILKNCDKDFDSLLRAKARNVVLLMPQKQVP